MTTTGVLGTRPAVSDDAVRAAMEQALGTTEPFEAEARWARVVAMAESRRLVAVADATEQDPDPLAGKRLSVAEQLHASNRDSRSASYATVKLAQRLRYRFPVLAEALGAGVVSLAQVRAIVAGWRDLPTWLSPEDLELHQREMVCAAASHDPRELRFMAQHVVEVVDPAGAEEAEAKRMAREERRANRGRFFTMDPDHHGSMTIRGSLPMADGEFIKTQLDALMPSAASYQHTEEGLPSRPARRADALVRWAHLIADSGTLPTTGGDRPHVSVTLSLETLMTGLGAATLLGSGEQLSATEARRLACDAGIIPVVLGTHGEVLDVGRAQRFFHGAARTALVLRDRGCAFPGCDAPPAACEGHHITPWHTGGTTNQTNGVLVCAYHHRLIEPDPRMDPDHQWAITFDERGDPEFVPPLQVDIQRRPRQHHRYHLRR